MSTPSDFVTYILEQLAGPYQIKSRNMFGEYMIYADDKPVFLLCDSILYVKPYPELADLLSTMGQPYPGAKEHYIVDCDDKELCQIVLQKVFPLATVPRKKKP